jgi:hypothetical protein
MLAHTIRLFAALFALALFATAAAQGNLITTGVYDPTGDGSNDIDLEATGNDITLAAFRTLVSDAYANNLGGVINFDELSNQLLNGFTADYGTSGTETLTVTVGSNNVIGPNQSGSAWNVRDASGSNGAISDPKVLRGAYTWDFDFDTGLSAVAGTIIRRSLAGGSVTATVELQDGTRLTKVTNQGIGSNTDVFFGYTALASNPIVSLELANGEFNEFDELGFVTAVIPEPGSLVLLGLGTVVLLIRYRLRACSEWRCIRAGLGCLAAFCPTP